MFASLLKRLVSREAISEQHTVFLPVVRRLSFEKKKAPEGPYI